MISRLQFAFTIIFHIIFPAIPFIVLAVVLYFQFVPLPAPPLNLAGPICAAWFVLGLIVVALLSTRSPAALASSDKIYVEE